ncbi:unnamed protein product [Caenorhabditis brenneri]
MSSNYSLRNGSRKRPHAQNAWKTEFQPIFDVLRSGFRYSKGERCRDEDRHTYVEEVLMIEYLEVGGVMTIIETCDLVRTKIIQPIRDFEDTEGVTKEAKRRATEIREKIERKLEEIAQSRNLCCSQEQHFYALNEAVCAGDSSCRIASGAEYYQNMEDGPLCTSHYKKKLDAVKGKKKKEQIKSEYERLYYDDYPEEETIKCKKCKRVVHKVCELYNPLINLPEANYLCSRCGGTRRNVGVSNLKATPSSQAVEAELNATMSAKGLTRDLYFRTLCCEERDGRIPEHEAMYCSNVQKLIARDCAHRFKMYGLFDRIEGHDVLIAVLAVDEYRGSKLPEWKRGVASIQYFDTAKYFEPRNLSRELNQSLLRIYSNYVREQGFKKILVYASAPSTPGSDYLINCPPLAKANLNQNGLYSYYQETFRGLTDTLNAQGISADVSNIIDLDKKRESVKSFCQELYVDSGFWADQLEQFLAPKNKENVGLDELKKFVENRTKTFSKCQFYVSFKQAGPLVFDEDPIMKSALAHSRISFLDTQMKNQWQFNSLRRAKYSSMMIISTLLKERNEL